MKKLSVVTVAFSVAMLAFAGTAGAAPAPGSPETLTITIDAAHPGGPSPATASGAFSGTGTDTRTAHFKHRVDRAKDVLTFDSGTVTVRDVGVRRTKLDKTTCTRQLTEKGVWKITSGSGSFLHAKGHGHYKATGTIQGVQGPNGCDFSSPTGTINVTAKGKVRD